MAPTAKQVKGHHYASHLQDSLVHSPGQKSLTQRQKNSLKTHRKGFVSTANKDSLGLAILSFLATLNRGEPKAPVLTLSASCPLCSARHKSLSWRQAG